MNFSQHNEQQVILDYFKNQKPEDLFFLDCGANDGKTFSNTHALALAGWFGICIEPGRMAFDKLSALYADTSHVTCFNIAITRVNGPVVLHESGSIDSEDIGLLSSCHYAETLKWIHDVKFTDLVVQGVSWTSFCETYIDSTYDFINIDAEGMDLEILFQMDLTELQCKLLCIEWGQDQAKKNSIHHYASKFGMKLVYSNETNLIYGM
jgi:FkbM family methyltransferase